MNLLKKSKKVEQDLHELVGQVLDDRLRIIRLSYVSPRQWLYEVEPPSVGKTRRALKVLGDPGGREPGSFYRLKITYDRLKNVSSPYIENVFECGTLHDLTPYVVTAWEPHISLYEYLRHRRKPLDWESAQSLFIEICHGLKSLHDRGVTHGDLRAHHILLREPPFGAVLIDFGVSTAFGAPPASGLDKSMAYWAPERLTFAAATPSTDLYSLGVLMYLCLTNHLPFEPHFDEENHESPKSPQEMLIINHRESTPPKLMGDVPLSIHSLIQCMLSKESQKRPPQVLDILEILENPEYFDESLEFISLNQDSQDHTALLVPPPLQESTPRDNKREAKRDSQKSDSQKSLSSSSSSEPSKSSLPSIPLLMMVSSLCVILGIVLAHLISG